MCHKSLCRLVRLSYLVLALSLRSHAAGLVVSPVRIELSSKQLTAMITLENQGGVDERYQLEPSAWSQTDGQDRYAFTNDLIVVPRSFNLRPGHSQVVRIGLRGVTSRPEASYRLFIQQLPEVRSSANAPSIVQTLLRVGVPVFIYNGPATKRQAKLEWFPITKEGQLVGFEITNPSEIHVQVGKLHIGGALAGMVGMYVLPGQRRTWMSPSPLPPLINSWAISAETDQGILSYEKSATP